MSDVVMYEVTQPVMEDGTEVYAPGHRFSSLADVPEGVRVRPVAVTGHDAAAADPAREPAEGGRPAVNAPKADWVAYAVTLGQDQSAAEAMTKAALIGACQ